MLIVPAIDIFEGKVVRLLRGDYNKVTPYNRHPIEMAKYLNGLGFTHLHVVDLEGARTGKSTLWNIVEAICSVTGLLVDVGGGIRTTEDAKRWLECGVNQINIGSAIIRNPDFFRSLCKEINAEKIIFSADERNGFLSLNGWTECSKNSVLDFVRSLHKYGLKYVSCTDIERDGTLRGVDAEKYKKYVQTLPVLWIAGGGIASPDDIEALKKAGCYACVLGRAIYEDETFFKKISGLLC